MKKTPPRTSDDRLSRTRLRYSFLKIPSGSDLSRRRLPYVEAVAPAPGPTVWLTACCHGDEVSGIVVVQEVFKRLRKLTLRRGAVHAFPLMNPLGFEMGMRHVSMSEEDLNRCFPGSATGTLAQRIAAKIFDTIVPTKPAVVLDLHNDWIRSIPYTVLDPHGGDEALARRTVSLAEHVGFPIVIEPEPIRHTLSHSLMQRGIAALTVELGESYVVNERYVEQGVSSVLNVLAALAMTDAPAQSFRPAHSAEVQGKQLRYSSQPVSSTSGILRFLARPGEIVRGGQPVAKVVNAFGRHLERLTAQHDALVLGHSDSSVAYPGAPVMAFGLL